jgi:arylsulfatase A-like enzyme
MADDLGWADIGCYGQKDIQTPNLDQMATDGIRFTQHYAGNSLCAPSRTSLMTGKHQGHASCRENESGKIGATEPTLGTVLKQAGYTTGCIGKWGCGESLKPSDPNDHGFEYFYGYVNTYHAHNYYPSFLYRNGEKDYTTNVVPNEGTGDKEGTGDASVKNEYSHNLFTEDTLKFIEERQQPFFLHLCYTIPHVNNEAAVKLEVPDLWTYEDKPWNFAMKAYASMISRMDRDIGRIRQKLEDLGIAENTLVLFTGDNGPHNKGGYKPSMFKSTGHLRGNKFSEYEGGIREPLIGWWPGHIQPGTVTDHVSAFWDFMPTVGESDPSCVSILGAVFKYKRKVSKGPADAALGRLERHTNH